MKKEFSVLSLVYIIFLGGLCGYVISSVSKDMVASLYAKKVIGSSDLALNEENIGNIFQGRDHKKVIHGVASWYGEYFDGKPMANGELFDMEKVSVAHRSLPLGTKVRVTNINNGKFIVAIVTDRGPYVKKEGRYSREIDLSKKAAEKLDAITEGVVPVRIETFI